MDKGLEKNITIADVAEALGVSKTTVSRAISCKGRIGRETRERVLAYIEEHDYKPYVIAKGLAQSITYNICVVMPGEYDVVDLTFFQECLFGIQEIAGSMEYDILLSICRKNDISSLERIIANHKVDGVILMRTFVEDEQMQQDRICFEGGEVKHIGHVLRMKTGEKIRISDQSGRSYFCRILEITEEEVWAQIEDTDEMGTEFSHKVYLFQGLPKSDKM